MSDGSEVHKKLEPLLPRPRGRNADVGIVYPSPRCMTDNEIDYANMALEDRNACSSL